MDVRLKKYIIADMAQSVERILGKDEVTGSIPVISSMKRLEIFKFQAFSIKFAIDPLEQRWIGLIKQGKERIVKIIC